MVFISYSSSDRGAAESLANEFATRGISFWIDFREIPIGRKFISEIASAIEDSTAYVILNPSRSLSSYWVRREYDAALRLRQTGRISKLIAVDSTFSAKTDLSNTVFDFLCSSAPEAADICESQSPTPRALGGGPTSQESIIVDFQGNDVDFSDSGIWLGRTAELLTMDNWLFGKSPGISIAGSSASGKSAFIHNWLYAFQRLGYMQLWSAAIELVDARISSDIKIPFPKSRSKTEHPCFVVIDSAEKLDGGKMSSAIVEAAQTGTRLIVVGQVVPAYDSFERILMPTLSEKDTFLLARSAGLTMEQSKVIHAATQGEAIFVASIIEALRDNEGS